MRRWVLAAALAASIAWAISAAAQQQSVWWFPLPRPTDSGKPIIYDPQFVAKGEADRISGCSPGLQCRVQVLGVIQNNGTVELRATAFTW